MADATAILIAGPTASGKSGLALAIAERDGRRRHQCRQHAGLPRACHPDRAALGGRSGARAACALRVRQRRRGLFRRPLRRRCRQCYRRSAGAGSACRSSSAAPGSTSRRCWKVCRPVPAADPQVRAYWRAQAAQRPAPELHALLAQRDPEMAARLMPTDPQRIVRALEVLESTGRSLADWQREPGTPVLAEDETVRLLVLPDRDTVGSAHRRPLRRHAGRRCGRGGAPAARLAASPTSCRSCGRSGWRSWPPTCAGSCNSMQPRRPPRPRRASTPNGRLLGFDEICMLGSRSMRNKWKE